MSRDYEYENNNIGYDEQYTEEDGGGIKCNNYNLCKNILPKWWFEYKSNYLCTNCYSLFIKNNEDNNNEYDNNINKKNIIDYIKYYFYNQIINKISESKYNEYICINWCKQFYNNKLHYINDIETDELSYLEINNPFNLELDQKDNIISKIKIE
jgi:hypothetical protein